MTSRKQVRFEGGEGGRRECQMGLCSEAVQKALSGNFGSCGNNNKKKKKTIACVGSNCAEANLAFTN
jgi:hypothetical protein